MMQRPNFSRFIGDVFTQCVNRNQANDRRTLCGNEHAVPDYHNMHLFNAHNSAIKKVINLSLRRQLGK